MKKDGVGFSVTFEQSMLKLKNEPQERIDIPNFGTRSFDPPHLCDINTALAVIPDFVKTQYIPVWGEVENYIQKELGYTYQCSVPPTIIEDCHGTLKARNSFVNGFKWAKDPSIANIYQTINYVIGDTPIWMKDYPNMSEIAKKLDEYRLRLKDTWEKFIGTQELRDKIDSEIKTYWKERWYQAHAWDFDKDERTFLDNPFD